MLINMDSDMNIEKFERNTKRNKSTYRLIYIICISSVILYIFFYFLLLNKLKIIKRKNDKIIKDLNQIINKLDKNLEKIDKNSTSNFLLNSQINRNEIFNEELKKKYKKISIIFAVVWIYFLIMKLKIRYKWLKLTMEMFHLICMYLEVKISLVGPL